MRKINTQVSIGLILLVGGGLLLLQNLNILQGDAVSIFRTVAMGFFSIYFLSIFVSNKNNWWAAGPGVVLLGFTVANLLELTLPEFAKTYNNTIIIGGIGLSFWVVYFSNRINWWAAIPGGVLLTMATVNLLDDTGMANMPIESILFLGFGITFLILFVIPTPFGRLKWAIYPALFLLAFGAVLGLGADNEIWNIVWPSAIIIAGVYFLLRPSFRKKPKVVDNSDTTI